MNDETKICSETGVVITKGMVAGCISDTFKSINGFRPRHIDFNAMSFDELGDMLDELQKEEEEAYLYEMEEEKRHEIWYNKILDELVVMGAGDRETAKRWLEVDHCNIEWSDNCILEDEREKYPEELEVV